MHLSDKERVNGIVIPGHQIASGTALDSPYPKGSIELQIPFFAQQGLDLSSCFKGTLNIDISPLSFRIIKPDFKYEHLKWIEGFPAETFSFVACSLEFKQIMYPSFVYYPHPETKSQHFQSTSTLEILAPKVPNISYGEQVSLLLNADKLHVFTSE